jgi:hypothetical protein
MKKALLFISSKGRYSQCRLAVESAVRWNPDCDVFIGCVEPLGSGYTEITMKEDGFTCWGKAEAARLLVRLGYTVMYLDGDTFSYGPMDYAWLCMEKGVSMLLFPHHLRPLSQSKDLSLANVALVGNYNAGMFGASPKALPFLTWWAEITKRKHESSPERGIFMDQGWLRFAPDFDDWTFVCRHPGYNLAYWNVDEREVSSFDGADYLVGEQELVVAHFSGMEKNLPPGVLSKYRRGEPVALDSPEWQLFSEYQRLL